MSPKELLYVQDALAHQKQLKNNCMAFAGQLQDQHLKSFVEQMAGQHQVCFDRFFNLLK